MLDDLVERLRASGNRVGANRRRLLEVLVQAPAPVSAEEAAGHVPGLSLSTVYRTFAALEDLGLLFHTHVDHRLAVYQLTERKRRDSMLVCERCGNRSELPASVLAAAQRTITNGHNFHPNFAHFAIGGLCGACHQSSPIGLAHAHS